MADGVVATDGVEQADLGYRLVRATDDRDGGNWVAWRWDGACLTLRNDRYGALPFYYAADASSITIASSIDQLLALGASATLDIDGLSVFLAVGYYVGDDTPFASIRALPPGSTLTWQRGDLSIEREEIRYRTAEMTREAAIDGVIAMARDAVARCRPDDGESFMMPVSGGRDSRHILLELLRHGQRPAACVTVRQYPTDWGGDAPYAARLCAELGVAHRILEPGPLVAAELRKNRLSSYGADEHAWYLPVVDALEGRTSRSYDGMGGGLLLHRDFMTRSVRRLQAAGRWDELAASLGKKDGGRSRFETLLRPVQRSILTADRAAARIRRELERHVGADDPFLSFTIWNRTIREIALAPSSMLGSVTTVHTPLMDPDFVAFAAAIPAELATTDLHDDAIVRAHPRTAGIPFLPRRRPYAGRAFMRGVGRDMLRLLRSDTAGSLVDRDRLAARAAIEMVTGGGWYAWGRRAALVTYLVQLEGLVAGSPERR